MDYQTKEYYFEHPEELEEFGSNGWTSLFDYEVFDPIDDIVIIERCGGKIFVYDYLLGSVSSREKNFMAKLMPDLRTVGDIHLLSYYFKATSAGFDILTVEMFDFDLMFSYSLEKFNIKRLAIYPQDGYSIQEISEFIGGDWEFVGKILNDEEDITALEFKKVEEQKRGEIK